MPVVKVMWNFYERWKVYTFVCICLYIIFLVLNICLTVSQGQKCLKVTENIYEVGGFTRENTYKCCILSSLRKFHVWNVFFVEEWNTHTQTHTHTPTTIGTQQNTEQTEACLFLESCLSSGFWESICPFSIAPNSWGTGSWCLTLAEPCPLTFSPGNLNLRGELGDGVC